MADELVRVASTADLARCQGAMKVVVNGKGVALFDAGGSLHAVENACPHRGAPLSSGDVKEMPDGGLGGGTAPQGEAAGRRNADPGRTSLFVVCPDHGWRFRLADGVCPEAGEECTLLVWDVKVEGEEILLSRLPRMAP